MLKGQKHRYEMFLRVRDFGASHQQVFPATSAAGQAFGRWPRRLRPSSRTRRCGS